MYLAGPDVFLPDALDIGRKRESCQRQGVTGLYPTDNTDIWHDLTSFKACVRLAAEKLG